MISKQLLVWLMSYYGGLAGGIMSPMYPLASYLIFYYLPPEHNWWGRSLPDLRYSLVAAIVLTISVLVCQGSLKRLAQVRNPALPWLVFFGLNALLVTQWAVDATRSWFWTVALLKLIVLYVLMPAVVRTPVNLDTFGAMHVAGATYWGWKAWEDPKREEGRLSNVGGPDTQDDNSASAHLLTVLPFSVFYLLKARRTAYKVGAAVATGFILNVFILCNSRGAMVGFVVAGLASIFLIGRRRRLKLSIVGVMGLLSLFILADPEFIARQQTTLNPQDASALSRIDMWWAGTEMVKDYPLGAGGRGYHALSPRYLPDLVSSSVPERSGHNTYTQVAVSWGIQGTLLLAGFMVSTFWVLHKTRRMSTRGSWFFYQSVVIEVSLLGNMAAGFFSDRLYGESIYWMCGLAFALYRMQATASDEATAEAKQAPSRSLDAFAGSAFPFRPLAGRTR